MATVSFDQMASLRRHGTRSQPALSSEASCVIETVNLESVGASALLARADSVRRGLTGSWFGRRQSAADVEE